MIKLFNTLTKKKQEFIPIKNKQVKIYSCGPTVYSIQHIGNLRSAVCWDILKRVFRYFNYKIIDVINITDVGHLVSDQNDGEDKMLKASREENKNPYEIAKFYTNIYINDIKKLNITLPKFMPKVTENILEQINIIKKLEKNGFTYKTSDGIYFNTLKFKDYGKFSGQNLKDKKIGARVELETEKKNPFDFALWKFLTKDNKNHIMRWESKWGEGFPGWHIECSALAHKYLGERFDIHTGGIEHIPIHHENEIAQNVCSGAIKEINFWLHNSHLIIDNKKMSKSLGNVYNLSHIIEKGFEPLALRLVFLKTHYRKKLNFTFDSLKSAQIDFMKINDFYENLDNLKVLDLKSQIENIYYNLIEKFENAIKDDLNISVALSTLYDFMHEFNKLEKISKKDIEFAKLFFQKTNIVFGILNDKKEIIPPQIIKIANQRKIAKQNKDFKLSDNLRDKILELGYFIKDDKDSKQGFILTKKN